MTTPYHNHRGDEQARQQFIKGAATLVAALPLFVVFIGALTLFAVGCAITDLFKR